MSLRLLYEPLIRTALLEDLGRAGDITSEALIPAADIAEAALVARADGCIAGLSASLLAFTLLDPTVSITPHVEDGALVAAGDALATLQGNTRALLAAERTALNLLCHLSGIATQTRAYVQATSGTAARIICTRKTTPGLRALEKEAVRCGGGHNHRFGLDDAVLIKDNHLIAVGGIVQALTLVRQRVGHLVKIEIEVDTLAQLDEALAHGADLILLDNMDLPNLREAVVRTRRRALLEASGSMQLARIADVAHTGVDFISVGALTHSSPILDLALDLLPPSIAATSLRHIAY